MSLKEILLASREAGDYTPAWEQLVNTKVFVSVLTNDSGPTTSDFRFEIAKSEQDGNPYVVVSDNLDDFQPYSDVRPEHFRLQRDSIAKQAGTKTADTPDHDFFGNPRSDTPSIGAIE